MKDSWWRRTDAGRGGASALGILLFAAAVPLLLRRHPLHRLASALEPRRLPPEPPAAAAVAATVQRVQESISAGWPLVRRGCLTRGLTLYRSLRRIGAEVELCFGVSQDHGGFGGHCWVEHRGQPLAERSDPRALYTEVWRVQPPAGSGSERAAHALPAAGARP